MCKNKTIWRIWLSSELGSAKRVEVWSKQIDSFVRGTRLLKFNVLC